MIALGEAEVAAIREHGRRAYPEECCGALLGRGGGPVTVVEAVRPLANVRRDERRRRFLVDPVDYLSIEREAQARGLEVLGFYHSHPDHPAAPSEFDRHHAWPNLHYLILAVAAGEPGEMTSWLLRDDRSMMESEPVLPPKEDRLMPKIALPTPLRPYAGGQASVEAAGGTVAEALAALTAQHPELRRHLFDDAGRLRSFVNVYRGDEDVRFLHGPATAVGEDETLWIVPSIAGGNPTAAETAPPTLSNDEIRRYARHLIIPEVGLAGQQKLKAARVLCVGAGGLGSPLTLYLAAAGVGTLGIVDFDVVDDSNLQRQILHGTRDVGRKKLDSAAERLRDVNPNVRIVPHETRLTAANALDILRDYDVVADGTDNFPTRYLVNDACVLLGKPNVYASIYRFEGQASVFFAAAGPCYRCLYPEPPPPGLVPSCAEGGVLGILPGLLGVIQATETVKLILGIGEPLIGRLLLVDALGLHFRELKLRKDPDCVLCGPKATQRTLIDYEQFCGIPQAEASRAREEGLPALTVQELKAKLDRGDAFVLLDVREPHEVEIASLPGSVRIPLRSLPESLAKLDAASEIVVHCKLGGRSAKAVKLLQDAGFGKVWNLTGGIDRWAADIDPTVARY